MSLSRQLILLISSLFVLVFAGTMVMSMGNMRDYLATQLESHAQDTATSLSLSLQPNFTSGDIPVMTSMVDAIFDSGYYSEIIVEKMDGERIIERVNEVSIDGVPGWFVSMFPLDTPRRHSLISSGWKPGATLYVRSHPGYAYIQLWNDTAGTFRWFLAVLAGAIILVMVALRFVLKPLIDIEAQAVGIANREFPVLEKLPWTRELRSVVIAMNKMSQKMKRIVTEQTERAESMRKEAYEDQVTALGNRRSFDMQLSHMVSAKEEVAFGALIIVQIIEFGKYNEKYGYPAGNSLLKQVADLLKQKSEGLRDSFVARIGGAEFAMLAQDTTVEDAENLGRLVGSGLSEFKIEGMEKGIGHVGIGYYSLDLTAPKLLAEADMALKHAQVKGPNEWHMFKEENLNKADIKGAQEWKDVIHKVIEAKSVSFLFQPAKPVKGEANLHYEALARIKNEDDSLIPAAVFMPMVERLKLTSDVDKLLVEKLLDRMESDHDSLSKFSINLFSESINDSGFINWLCETLKDRKNAAKRIFFEVSEHTALHDESSFIKLIDRLKKFGAGITLDNFGSISTSYGYLSGLKLEFLKIDGSYIRDIDKNKDNQHFIQAIIDIAHGLDIKVIAKSVETDEELKALEQLKVDGAQGYLVGKPGEET